MASRGQSVTLEFVDWDATNNAYKTGDASNITLRWVKDGTSAAPDGSPTISEVDSTNAPGIYKVTLDATDCTCNVGMLCGKTSSSGCVIIPVEIAFEQLPTAASGSSGGLLSFGTSTGQVNPSSGKVPATLAATDVTGNVPANAKQIQSVQAPTPILGVDGSTYVLPAKVATGDGIDARRVMRAIYDTSAAIGGSGSSAPAFTQGVWTPITPSGGAVASWANADGSVLVLNADGVTWTISNSDATITGQLDAGQASPFIYGATWTYTAGGSGPFFTALSIESIAASDIATGLGVSPAAGTAAIAAYAPATLANQTSQGTGALATSAQAVAILAAIPTTAEIATAVFQDVTAGDFTVAHSFGSMVANIGSGTVQFTAGALANAPTGASAADVWDYLTSSIDTSGSIGVALLAGLAKLGTSTGVTVVSPVAENKYVTIYRGSSYDTSTAQAITFSDDGSWPIMTSGGVQLGTVEVKCVIGSGTPDTELSCTVTGTSPNQVVTVTATAAETEAIPATAIAQAGLPAPMWDMQVVASVDYPTNSEIRLLIDGGATVITPLTVTW